MYVGQIDLPALLGNTKPLTTTDVVSNFCAMDNIFARQTSNVCTGATNVASFNDGGANALCGPGPSEKFTGITTAKDQYVIFFWLYHIIYRFI